MVNFDLTGEHPWVSVPEKLDSVIELNEDDIIEEEVLNQVIEDGINCMAQLAFENADAKGFHNPPPSFPESLALIHSEVSEALEDYRKGHLPQAIWYTDEGKKICGIGSELADVVIRVGHLAAMHKIDLGSIVVQKMEYNKTRSHRHGNKVL